MCWMSTNIKERKVESKICALNMTGRVIYKIKMDQRMMGRPIIYAT